MRKLTTKSRLIYSIINSPLGNIIIAEFNGKIVFLEFSGNKRAKTVLNKISTSLGASPQKGDTVVLKKTAKQLGMYFNGKLDKFDLPLQIVGTDFQKKVWRQLNFIPYGKTRNYGWVAEKIKNNSARAAGQAIGKNPISIIVPCHRVIGKDGSLTGFGGGIKRKKWLLKHEGSI